MHSEAGARGGDYTAFRIYYPSSYTRESGNISLENSYSVHELCEALGVPRGTLYNHIFWRVDKNQYEAEAIQLALKVKQVFDDGVQRYGAEKIRTVLASSGIHISKRCIAAIMRELGLHSVRVDAEKLHKRKQQLKKKTCWKESFQLVIKTFKAAYQERGRPGSLTFHSDRGSQVYFKGADRSFSVMCCQAVLLCFGKAAGQYCCGSLLFDLQARRSISPGVQHFRRNVEA